MRRRTAPRATAGRPSVARPRTLLPLVVVGVAVVAAACDTGDGRQLADPDAPLPPSTTAAPPSTVATAPTLPQGLTLLAPWENDGAIPSRHTCDADDVAPALTWLEVPAGTVELAVTMIDIDAGDFVHWVLVGIPPDRSGLIEGELPDGAFHWVNSFGVAAYGGPCPPADETHRYLLRVHALNQQLEAADDASAAEVITLIEQTSIGTSSVTGVYARLP